MDKLWDSSMGTLSEGYVQAVDSLEAGAGREALDVFRAKYLAMVKAIYSEAPSSQPVRFECMTDWEEWARGFYIKSVQADKAMAATPAKGSDAWRQAREKLGAIRAHFASLHEKSDTSMSGDVIFALRQECAKDQPDATVLKQLQGALDKAPASKKARAEAGQYKEARAEWDKTLKPLLDKGAIAKESVEPLRAAAEKFYQAFGVQLE